MISWLKNRFIFKTHALTSRQLKRGAYHEIDTRILFCIFDTLVDYVEVELAWLHTIVTQGKTFKIKRLGFRSPDAGLARLRWELGLIHDDLPSEDPRYGRKTAQALAAVEVLELYVWWTAIRPYRTERFDSVDEQIRWESIYEQEDQRMLHRLIDVRGGLWT